jgi:methionyl aminopeptidase
MEIKEQIMREAGRKLALIFSHVLPGLTEGLTLRSVDDQVGSLLKSYGARSALKMVGFPGNIAISIDKEVIQGKPDNRKLQPGDLVSLDMTLYYSGFFVDKAVSVVLYPQHYIKKYLVNAAYKCLETAINNMRPGIKTGEIGALIEAQASALKVRVSKEFYGHSIGESHHMKPLLPNFNDGSQDLIRKGDFLAVEPIVFYNHYTLEHRGMDVRADELSAQFEDTVIVTDTGAEVITKW